MSLSVRYFRRSVGIVAISAIAFAMLYLALDTRDGRALSRAGMIPGMTIDETPAPWKGLVVTSLRTGSEAEHAGIIAGDRVIAINRHPVSSLREAGRLIGKSDTQELELEILHNRMRQDIVLQLE